MKLQLISLLVVLFFLGSCAQAQFGYSSQSKKAIKLFEKARQIASESFDEFTMQPDYKSAIMVLKQALNKDPKFLEKILLDFGVSGDNKKVSHGPVVTLCLLYTSPSTRDRG